MQKQETLTPSICGKCGVEERYLLLHVRCRSISRRLCPSCILRSHQQYFCPTCYAYYGSSPPTGPEFVNCTECYSVSHSRCAAASTAPYLCPLCVHPHSPIFAPRRAKDGRREIDSKSATILFTAARIAASTMEKAAEVAKAEAEKRAKEAACTRKRAKEALEHIALLEVKERLKRKEISSAQASGSGNSSVLDRNLKPCNVNNNQNPKKDPNRVSNQLGVVVDGPNEVSARLNAVGLKEKDRSPASAFAGPVEASPALKTIGTVMDDNERKRVLSSQNVAKVNNGLSSVSAGGLSNNSMGAKTNSGLYSPGSLSNNSKTGLYPGGVSNNSVVVKAKTGLYSQNPGGLSNNSMGAKTNAGLYSAPSTGSQNVVGASSNSTLAKANNGLHSVPSSANSQNVGGSTNSSSAAASSAAGKPPFSHDRQQNIHVQEESPFRKQ